MNHNQMLVDAGWDPWLVALSYLVAALASYSALDLAGRVASSGGGRGGCGSRGAPWRWG